MGVTLCGVYRRGRGIRILCADMFSRRLSRANMACARVLLRTTADLERVTVWRALKASLFGGRRGVSCDLTRR